MSSANDAAWSSTEFHLAKVARKHADKDLVIVFFDAGDFGGSKPDPSDTVEVIAVQRRHAELRVPSS